MYMRNSSPVLLNYCKKHTPHTTSHDSFSLYLSLEISVSVVLEQELHHSSTTTISCCVKWSGSVLRGETINQ